MEIRFPWEPRTSEERNPPAEKSFSRKTSGATRGRRRIQYYTALAETTTSGFIYAHLTVAGPETAVGDFEQCARGPGVTPWQFDPDILEEDIFLMAMQAPNRSLTVEGCRIMARQFRQRAEERYHRTLARSAEADTRCPLDLNVLLPVPERLLRKGAGDPQSQVWMRTQWGVTSALCKVIVLPEKKRHRSNGQKHRILRYGFFAEETLPEAAVKQFAKRWPTLEFTLDRAECF